MRIHLYHRCSTCIKAVRWLSDRGATFETRDIVADPPDRATLEDLWRRSGQPLRKLFNTSGRSFRSGGWSARLDAIADDEALDALAADEMLIRRPLLDVGGRVLVGFRPDEWSAALADAERR